MVLACSRAAAKAGQRRGVPAVLAAGATDPRPPLARLQTPFFGAEGIGGAQHSGALFLLGNFAHHFRPPTEHRRDLLRTPPPSFIRFSPLRSPACSPAAHRRPFRGTTGYFRRKPLPPSQRGLHHFHKSWSRSTASRRRLYPRRLTLTPSRLRSGGG
jgi:hypothetical protein